MLAWSYGEHETARDLIDYIENSAGSPSATVSKYDYVNDVLARRTRVDLTGPAFSATGNHHVQFGYNDRSELTAADRYQGNGASPPYTHLTQDGHEFDYVYDLIGNRLTYALDGSGVSYCTNALNQPLTRRNSPCEFDRETIAGQGPKRVKGQYTDIGSAITCPPSTPTLSHDLDGNMTSDGTLVYEWDAENRLIRVVPASLPAEGSKKCEFTYDYMNRRVRKQVFTWNTGALAWNTAPESDLRFVYDGPALDTPEHGASQGWNVALALNASGTPQMKRTWGLDLSGLGGLSGNSGVHAAGGIGGLLACQEMLGTHEGSYWFLHDANGNVGQAIFAASQLVAAHHEYDPYGNALVALGEYAEANPFRFSTKWFDTETGAICYGGRYFEPRHGRWLSRDPIGEEDDANLYLALLNRPVDSQDPIGFAAVSGSQPSSQPSSQPCSDPCNGPPSDDCLMKKLANCPQFKVKCCKKNDTSDNDCKDCDKDPNMGGETIGDKKIILCKGNSGGSLTETLRHEMFHLLSACARHKEWRGYDCKTRVRDEYRAYKCSGECQPAGHNNPWGNGDPLKTVKQCALEGMKRSVMGGNDERCKSLTDGEYSAIISDPGGSGTTGCDGCRYDPAPGPTPRPRPIAP